MLTFVVEQAMKWRNNKELQRRPSLYQKGHVFPELLVQLFFFFFFLKGTTYKMMTYHFLLLSGSN